MPPRFVIAWSRVLGGGIGKRLDRLHDGRIIDFMSVGIGSLRTGAFNVADVCLTISVSLLMPEALQRPRVPGNG